MLRLLLRRGVIRCLVRSGRHRVSAFAQPQYPTDADDCADWECGLLFEVLPNLPMELVAHISLANAEGFMA